MKGRDWNSDRRASGGEREGVLHRELERPGFGEMAGGGELGEMAGELGGRNCGGGKFWPGKQWVLRVGVERNLGAGRGGRRWRRMGLGGLQIGVDGKW